MNNQNDSTGHQSSLPSDHHHQYGKGDNDPYEFDDENPQAPAVNMEGLKMKMKVPDTKILWIDLWNKR